MSSAAAKSGRGTGAIPRRQTSDPGFSYITVVQVGNTVTGSGVASAADWVRNLAEGVGARLG